MLEHTGGCPATRGVEAPSFQRIHLARSLYREFHSTLGIDASQDLSRIVGAIRVGPITLRTLPVINGFFRPVDSAAVGYGA